MGKIKKWQVFAVLGLLIAVNAAGFAALKVWQDREPVYLFGIEAGSDVANGSTIFLGPERGAYYFCHIWSQYGQPFDVLFMNDSAYHAAKAGGSPAYVQDRSVFNVTSVDLEGRLPDTASGYWLVVLSIEPGTEVVMAAGEDYLIDYPPDLLPVLEVIVQVCQVSNIVLFILLIYTFSAYSRERKQGY